MAVDFLPVPTPDNKLTGKVVREAINSVLAAGVRVSTLAALATTSIPAEAKTVILTGYAAKGDAPDARLRRALVGSNPFEGSFPGARTDADGNKWVYDESELVPEWFGAKADGDGITSALNPDPVQAAKAGADDTDAINAMIAAAQALKTGCGIPANKSYRCAKSINTPAGQKTLLIHSHNFKFFWRGRLLNDGYTNNQGSPMMLWSDGLVNNGTKNRVKNVQIFVLGGEHVYTSDGTKPGASGRGGITLYAVDGGFISRPATSGLKDTNFQVTIFHSNNTLTDFGRIGLPNAPTGTGDDGYHVIGDCYGNIAIGGFSNSGDDALSFTMEHGFVNMTQRDNVVTSWICSTEAAKTIKIHIDNSTNGCVIRDMLFDNIRGTVRGLVTGAGIVVLNEGQATNKIEDIRFNNMILDCGTAPKSSPNAGTDGGNFFYVRGAKNVWLSDSTLRGSSNSMAIFRDAVGGGFDNVLIQPKGDMAAFAGLKDMPIANLTINGNGTKRFTFSGDIDLTPIETIVAKQAAAATHEDNKFAFLTTTNMATTGQQGRFKILAANAAGKYVDVENVRSGSAAEAPPANATGTITLSKTPDICIYDSRSVNLDVTVDGPMGWTAIFVGTRGGTVGRDNAVTARINDQFGGHAFYQARGFGTKVDIEARRAKSGSDGIIIPAVNGVADQFNHISRFHDYAGIADATQGYARAMQLGYASDRVDLVRGRTNSRIKGTATIPTTAALITITVNSGVVGAIPGAMIDESWITITPTNAACAGWWVVWDPAAFTFTINLPAAPSAAAVFKYKIAPST